MNIGIIGLGSYSSVGYRLSEEVSRGLEFEKLLINDKDRWDKVEEQTKVSHDLLKLYARSGPVPVTIINNLKKLLEDQPK